MTATTACVPGRRQIESSPSGRGLKWLWLPIAVFALQLAAIHLFAPIAGGDALGPVLVATHLALLPFLLANRRLIGISILAAGLALNVLVMAANGGLMPVTPRDVERVGRHDVAALEMNEHIAGTKNVLLERSDANLPVLSDVLFLDAPQPLRKVISAGDIFIFAGVVLTFGQLLVARDFRRAPRSRPPLAAAG